MTEVLNNSDAYIYLVADVCSESNIHTVEREFEEEHTNGENGITHIEPPLNFLDSISPPLSDWTCYICGSSLFGKKKRRRSKIVKNVWQCKKCWQKEYYNRPEVKAHALAYGKEYRNRPGVKERQQQYCYEYTRRPDIRERKRKQQVERRKDSNVREKEKKYKKEYRQRPEIKERMKKLRQTTEYKEYMNQFFSSEEYKKWKNDYYRGYNKRPYRIKHLEQKRKQRLIDRLGTCNCELCGVHKKGMEIHHVQYYDEGLPEEHVVCRKCHAPLLKKSFSTPQERREEWNQLIKAKKKLCSDREVKVIGMG